MVYPGAGIPVSTGSAWGSSLAAPTGTFADTGVANTFAAGMKQTFQSTTTTAGFNIPPVVSVSAPVSGDVWITDSISPAFNYRRSTATYSLLSTGFTQTLTANHKLTSGTGVPSPYNPERPIQAHRTEFSTARMPHLTALEHPARRR